MRLFDTVPDNWNLVELRDITDINPTHPDEPPQDHELATFVPMKKIEELTGRMDPSKLKEWGEIKGGYTRFQEGDVVFAKITPSMENGKVALAENLENGVAAGSTELHVIRPSREVLAEYVLYFVLQEGFRREAEMNMAGTAGHMRVPSEFMKQVEIPLPPIEEQKSIVNKIEKLFSKLDSGVSELEEASRRFVQYRRSVLRNAMRGKLTENWRTESKVDNQRGNILNDVEPLSDERVNQLYDVPESWVWTKFGEIVEKSRNGFSKRSGEDGIPTPVLRLADIKQGKIEYSDPRNIRMKNIERDKFLLESGDLLCTRVNGSENLVGRLAVFDEDGDWAFCDHFIRYKLKEFAIPRFVDMWFDSSSARRYVQSNMVSTAGQNTVSQTTMEEAPMPLCSIEEQEKIMERIDQRISVIEYLISTTDQVQTKAKSLRESILEQAFNNELLKPNTTEEPIPPDSGDTDLEQ